MAGFGLWKLAWSGKLPAGSGLAAPDLMAPVHLVMAFTPAALFTNDLVGFSGSSYSWPPYSYSMLRKVSVFGPSNPVTPLLGSARTAASAKDVSPVPGRGM